MSSFWHGFADMGAVDGHEFVVARGEGCYVWDEAGRRYLDGTASLWYANVGYGRREIADAVAAQLQTLHAYHTFGEYATRPVLDLADRLAAIAPVAGSKVFFTSGGSDSVDTAVQPARRSAHRPADSPLSPRHRCSRPESRLPEAGPPAAAAGHQ